MAQETIPWWRKALRFALEGIRTGWGLLKRPGIEPPAQEPVAVAAAVAVVVDTLDKQDTQSHDKAQPETTTQVAEIQVEDPKEDALTDRSLNSDPIVPESQSAAEVVVPAEPEAAPLQEMAAGPETPAPEPASEPVPGPTSASETEPEQIAASEPAPVPSVEEAPAETAEAVPTPADTVEAPIEAVEAEAETTIQTEAVQAEVMQAEVEASIPPEPQEMAEAVPAAEVAEAAAPTPAPEPVPAPEAEPAPAAEFPVEQAITESAPDETVEEAASEAPPIEIVADEAAPAESAEAVADSSEAAESSVEPPVEAPVEVPTAVAEELPPVEAAGVPEPTSVTPAQATEVVPATPPGPTPAEKSAARVVAAVKAREASPDGFPFSVMVGKVYDGPMDLLLDLIRKQDIDIYDIPIARITAQFLAYVNQLKASDVDVAGEFIYTASLLIHIKSKMLLPRTPSGSEDAAEDPRRELVERLLEHERFKNAAQMLQQKQMLEAATWTNPGMREFRDDAAAEPEIAADTVDLIRIFREILERARNRPVLDVQEDTVTVGQMIRFLGRRLTMEDKPVALRKLLSQTRSERALIAMFLALLELVRMQAILLRQDCHFSEIFIKKHSGFDAVMNEGMASARDDWR